MALRDILDNLKSKFNDEPEEIDDDATKDRFLRSLRRQRRVQMEKLEKERLLKEIKAFQKAEEKKFLWGVDNEKTKEKTLLSAIKTKKKKLEIMKAKSILLNKANTVKKSPKQKNILNNGGGFLGKGGLI
jgi:hypothetical protein